MKRTWAIIGVSDVPSSFKWMIVFFGGAVELLSKVIVERDGFVDQSFHGSAKQAQIITTEVVYITWQISQSRNETVLRWMHVFGFGVTRVRIRFREEFSSRPRSTRVRLEILTFETTPFDQCTMPVNH